MFVGTIFGVTIFAIIPGFTLKMLLAFTLLFTTIFQTIIYYESLSKPKSQDRIEDCTSKGYVLRPKNTNGYSVLIDSGNSPFDASVYEKLDPFGVYELVDCATSEATDFDLRGVLSEFTKEVMTKQAQKYNWKIPEEVVFTPIYVVEEPNITKT